MRQFGGERERKNVLFIGTRTNCWIGGEDDGLGL